MIYKAISIRLFPMLHVAHRAEGKEGGVKCGVTGRVGRARLELALAAVGGFGAHSLHVCQLRGRDGQARVQLELPSGRHAEKKAKTKWEEEGIDNDRKGEEKMCEKEKTRDGASGRVRKTDQKRV